MGIKLADTLEPMADFPSAYAKDIAFDDGDTLQEKLDTGSLGGGGVGYKQLSQAEYDALTEDEKMDGREYRTYDTGHIYKLGVEYGKDGVQISDNETVEDKTWSSKKTSDEIAKVETELEDYMNIKYNLLEPSTDLNTLIVAGMYMSKWGSSNSLVNKPSGFSSDYEVIVTVTPLKRIGNYGEYIEQTFVSRTPKSPVYRRIIENKAPTQPDWTELATMDKVALKQEYFDKKVTLTDSNWKYKKLTFTKSYTNTPSINISCGDYLNIDFHSYWGCEAYIINVNNKGCTIRYRSSKASASEPLEVSIIVFVNGI